MESRRATGGVVGSLLLAVLVCLAVAPANGVDTSRLPESIENVPARSLPDTVRHFSPEVHDLGPVDGGFVLPYITMILKPTSKQQAGLNSLLRLQQSKSSSEYHQWLTPEEYADRFGATVDDIRAIEGWLQKGGFSVVQIARGRNWISFRGTEAQVEATFRTQVHKYEWSGRVHYANASPVSLPMGLVDKVAGFAGLDDFAPAASIRQSAPDLRGVSDPRPHNTIVTTEANTGRVLISHFLSPDDVATIYDTIPLYAAQIDGDGQSLVVVGQSGISLQDVQLFRQTFNLPALNPTLLLVPGSPDPGPTNDEFQGTMDVEWAGAIARQAKITYVFTAPSAGGAFAAAQYAIDNDLAPVIAMSYGACEQSMAGSGISAFETELQKANALGITIVASSGTAGAAACDATDTYPTLQASQGLAVNYPASSPEVTGVGGTQLNEGTGAYWNFENTTNSASVLSYVPEGTWNDTSSVKNLSASGGGPSSCITLNGSTCAAGFPKPSWQNVAGVPNDGVRDVPDLAFAAAQSHDAYIVCIYDNCTPGNGPVQTTVQGTSAATAVVGGVMALLNQYVVENAIQSSPGLGNVNPNLYSLAQIGYGGVFHDITSGDNIVPCAPDTPNCQVVSPTTPNPLPFGFSATTGYDPVTGLGSLDVNNMLTAWNWRFENNVKATITRLSVLVPLTSIPAQQVTPGTQLDFNVTVGANAVTPATGLVTLFNAGSQIGSGTLINGIADILATPPMGGYSITAVYSGDTNYSGSTSAPASLFVADFTITTPADLTFTVQRGSVATIPIVITPAFTNYTPTVSLLCFGAPTESTCTFSPSTVQPVGGPVVTTMRIQTTQPASSLRPVKSSVFALIFGLSLPAGICAVAFGNQKSVRSRIVIGISVLLISCSWCLGCTSARPPAQDPGSQPTGPIAIRVTATTGGKNPIFHTLNLTMTLQ